MNKAKTDTCILEFCNEKYYGRGLCKKHLYHFKRMQPLVDYNKAEDAPESASVETPCKILHEDISNRDTYIKNHISSTNQLLTRKSVQFDTLVMTCDNPNCFEYSHIDWAKSVPKSPRS